MSKKKITSQDFLNLMQEEEEFHSSYQKRSLNKINSGSLDDSQALQTDSKVEPNISQSEAKVEPNIGQTRLLLKPKLSQKVEPNKLKNQKLEPQPEPQLEPYLSQSEAKVEPNQSFASLVGLQRNALIFIYESCRLKGDLLSAPITIQNIADFLRTTTAAARKAIQRLENKGYINRAAYKDGRGGWSQYRLTNFIYNELLHQETRAKVEPKLGQTRAKVEPQPEPQPEPSPSSSSSYLYKDTTTTTKPDVDNSGWDLIQTPSNVKDLGFGSLQIQQLAKLGIISPDDVQESLEAFSYDLEGGKVRSKGSRLGLLMGIMRNGSKYLSETFNEEMKSFLAANEKRRQELEDVERARAEDTLSQKADEELQKLTDAQKVELVPENAIARVGSPMHTRLVISELKQKFLGRSKRLPFTE